MAEYQPLAVEVGLERAPETDLDRSHAVGEMGSEDDSSDDSWAAVLGTPPRPVASMMADVEQEQDPVLRLSTAQHQAERGTPVTDDDDGADPGRPRKKDLADRPRHYKVDMW